MMKTLTEGRVTKTPIGIIAFALFAAVLSGCVTGASDEVLEPSGTKNNLVEGNAADATDAGATGGEPLPPEVGNVTTRFSGEGSRSAFVAVAGPEVGPERPGAFQALGESRPYALPILQSHRAHYIDVNVTWSHTSPTNRVLWLVLWAEAKLPDGTVNYTIAAPKVKGESPLRIAAKVNATPENATGVTYRLRVISDAIVDDDTVLLAAGVEQKFWAEGVVVHAPAATRQEGAAAS